MKEDSINIHSEEIQDIFGRQPNWIMRWGIIVMFSITGLFCVLATIIRYPETLSAKIVVTSQTPPITVVTRGEGTLILFVNNNQTVEKGTVLGYIKNEATYDDVLAVKLALDKYKSRNDESHKIIFNEIPQDQALGELQEYYVNFLESLANYRLHLKVGSQEKQISSLKSRILFHEQLRNKLNQQVQVLQQEMRLHEKRFNIDNQLYQEKVISEIDYDKTKLTFFQSQRILDEGQRAIINNEIIISQIKGQIGDLEALIADIDGQKSEAIRNNLKLLQNQINTWEKQYVLKSPLDGSVALNKYWSDEQFIRFGEQILTIVPNSKSLFGKMSLPVSGSGKMEVGQRVIIKFDNYPANEYGSVKGIVKAISTVPYENSYTVIIDFPEGLHTTYGKELLFKQEMQGNALVITKDISLIERILNQFKSIIDQSR